MAEEEDVQNQGFKVKDARRFDAEGNPREESAEPEPAPEPAEPAAAETPPEPSSTEAEADEGHQALPADLPSLFFSLASSAQSALGIAPNPTTGALEVNLPQAKYAVDLLGILQDKTKGNLTPEEEQLLQALLTDLRMRYLEAQKES